MSQNSLLCLKNLSSLSRIFICSIVVGVERSRTVILQVSDCWPCSLGHLSSSKWFRDTGCRWGIGSLLNSSNLQVKIFSNFPWERCELG